MGCKLVCGDISNVLATQNGDTAALQCFASARNGKCPKLVRDAPYSFNTKCLEDW